MTSDNAKSLDAPSAGSASPQDGIQKHLARGLEDVSHLFLSQNGAAGPARPEPASPNPSLVMLSPSAAVGREQLIALLARDAAVLEQGMRVLDVGVPCEPCGPIDLLGASSANHPVVIDIDTVPSDGMLLRAVSQVDWLVRNGGILRRLYNAATANFSLQPRIVLVAPQFSPNMASAAHRMTAPRVTCIRYHAVALPAGTGIVFEAQ
jgi:hypothetical protein